MQKIILVAKSSNNAIGRANDLLWHLPADLEFFTKTIANQWLLTGRKSFESAQGSDVFAHPEKAIIITRKENYQAGAAKVAHSLQEGLEIARQAGVDRLYMLGGGEIYRQSMAYADLLLVTEVHAHFEADTFFPEIDLRLWHEISRVDCFKDAENSYDYSFVSYGRL